MVNSTNKNANSTLTGNNTANNMDNPVNVTMGVTSSIAKNGKLANITSSFSQYTISLEKSASDIGPSPQSKTTLEINPTKDVIPGNYTLTISAKYGKDITVSKMVDIEIK